jgi:hypothetical protein
LSDRFQIGGAINNEEAVRSGDPDVPEREFVITIRKNLTKIGAGISPHFSKQPKNSQVNRVGHKFRFGNDEKSLVISSSIRPAFVGHGGTVARFSESVLK